MGERMQVPLDEVYEFASGLSKPRSAFGSGYPFLSFKDVFYRFFVPNDLSELVNSNEQERARCSIKRGDVFLTRTSETMDELGMSCVALRDVPNGTFNGFTKRLRPKSDDRVVPDYAGYFFRSPAFRRAVTAMSSMSTRASLNNEMLARLSITLPPVEVQKAIGGILRALDDKIELNRQTNETLEALARAIFKDWFVDFGPTRAKAEGRQPYLAPELWELFPDELDDEDKPLGWSFVTIADLVNHVQNGGTPARKNTNYWSAGTIPWFKTGELFDRFLITSEECITKAGLAAIGGKIWPPGTILFAIYASPTVGRMGILTSAASANQACCALQPRNEIGLPFLFYVLLMSREKLQNIAVGAAQQNISQKILLEYFTVYPGDILTRQFSDKVLPLLNKIQHNQQEEDTLAQTRDLLLPKLMSGEIRLQDAERIVGEIV